MICHYTSGSGLLGILKSKSIWATDIFFLNDYKEFSIGANIIFDRINDQRKINPFSKNHEIVNKIVCGVIENLGNLEKIKKYKHYIASFTDKRDDLKQWMSYGDKNSSYCIVFKDYSFSLKSDGVCDFSIEKVEYEGRYSLLDYFFSDRIYNEINSMNVPVGDDYIDKKIDSYTRMLLVKFCTHKEAGFSSESETRIVCQRYFDESVKNGEGHIKTEFHVKSGVLVPYVCIPIEPSFIEEIIIGPNMHKELAERGLEELKKVLHMEYKISHTQQSLRQY